MRLEMIVSRRNLGRAIHGEPLGSHWVCSIYLLASRIGRAEDQEQQPQNVKTNATTALLWLFRSPTAGCLWRFQHQLHGERGPCYFFEGKQHFQQSMSSKGSFAQKRVKQNGQGAWVSPRRSHPPQGHTHPLQSHPPHRVTHPQGHTHTQRIRPANFLKHFTLTNRKKTPPDPSSNLGPRTSPLRPSKFYEALRARRSPRGKWVVLRAVSRRIITAQRRRLRRADHANFGDAPRIHRISRDRVGKRRN